MSAIGKEEIRGLTEICQNLFHRKEMLYESQSSALVPIFKTKVDLLNCSSYRGVKLLKHGMRIVE